MKEVRYMFFTLLFSGFVLTAASQESRQFDPVKDDISERLIPLNAMINSALKYDPPIHYRDLQTIVNKCKLQANPSGWIRNIKVQTEMHNGTFDRFKNSNFIISNSRLLQF